jgi:hypothetical protein
MRTGFVVVVCSTVAGFWVAASLALAQQPAPTPPTGQRPNIVFMFMDNLGYGELGVYGGGILRGATTKTTRLPWGDLG